MDNADRLDAVTEFYRTHPISEAQIVGRLKADGIDLATVTEDILQHHDQDHFGGVEANDALAKLAGIDVDSEVLDVCCGLGGPARYLAHHHGCRVTGIDMTSSRIEGARRLSEMAGLDERVSFVTGNALNMPLPDAAFDVVISQEAFCHVPDKVRLIAECARVLKPGGRMAFTDILAMEQTDPAVRKRLESEMTHIELASRGSYSRMLRDAGCELVAFKDLSAEWERILVDRLKMYRSLKDQTVARFGAAHFEKWDRAYEFFVAQYGTGQLGGGRFLVRRSGGG